MRVASIAFLLSIAVAVPVPAQTSSDSSGATGQAGGVTAEAPTDSAQTAMPEPGIIDRALTVANQWLVDSGAPARSGFYADFGNMITGAGWISAGPGYRQFLFGDRAFVDASAAISWRAYKMAQARFELPRLADDRLAVGSQVRWQDLTQVDYFGIGPDSPEGARSQYRLKSTDVVGYAAYQANSWLSIGGTAGWLHQPTLSSPTGPFQGDWPDTLHAFPHDPGVASQPSFLHGSASIAADNRDHPGHPTSGGLYRAAVTSYADRDTGRSSFQRYDVEGLQIVPVRGASWLLAMHGWAAFSSTSSGDEVPFYMLPTLGGENTLRGYDNYRFHDRHMLVATAESRWAIFRYVDAAAFFDAGNVAARPADLNLNKTSWGGGLRLHVRRSTLGRVDVGHSAEGWHVFFKLDDPFALKRLSRRTAEVPFVP